MIAVSGPLQGRSFPLRGTSCLVGRQGGCDIQILDLAVSRGHCRVERGGDGAWSLHDLDSRYGTFVNGQPVRQRALEHGDVVQLGGTSLVFLAPAAESQRDPSQPSLLAGPLVAQSTAQRRVDDHPFARRAVWPAAGALGADVARVAEERGALLRLCSTAQSARDVEALGDGVLELLRARLPASRGVVLFAADEASRAARPEVADLRQVTCSPPTAAERPVSQAMVAQVLKERAALLCRDVASDAALGRAASLEDGRVSSLLGAPLTAGERVLGVIYLEAERAHAFEERHLELLVAVAAIASLCLERLLQLTWLKQENRKLRGGGGEGGASGGDRLGGLVGESAAMQRLRAVVRRVGATSSTVLLRGERGTGKELCARAIHAASARADGPFVSIRCASLADSLLESELFGHEQGAFTGAIARKLGKVEAAHGGTLFLGELGELSPPLQARLLRVLQERELDRVGGAKPISVDVRVVAATNRDLEAAVRAGKLREDLLHRLNVVTLATPPLRERREDILLLARHFARGAGERVGRRVVGISEAARTALVAYDWPGNVRELGNVIERALVLGEGEVIELEDLPDEVLAARPRGGGAVRDPDEASGPHAQGAPAASFHDAVLATKRRLIADAYHRADGDHTRAAALLGVHANSLHRLIRALGLESEFAKTATSSP